MYDRFRPPRPHIGREQRECELALAPKWCLSGRAAAAVSESRARLIEHPGENVAEIVGKDLNLPKGAQLSQHPNCAKAPEMVSSCRGWFRSSHVALLQCRYVIGQHQGLSLRLRHGLKGKLPYHHEWETYAMRGVAC